MSTCHYAKYRKIYRLVDDRTQEVLARGHKVAIVFDSYSFELVKHGMADKVEKWYKRTRKRFQKLGRTDDISGLTLLSSDKWDVSDLWKLLELPGYIKRFMQYYGFREGVRYEVAAVPLLRGPVDSIVEIADNQIKPAYDQPTYQIIEPLWERPKLGPKSVHNRRRKKKIISGK